MTQMKRIAIFLVFVLSLPSLACDRITASIVSTATYKVEGMTCDACAANIETSISEIEGVHSARVSFADGKAEVTYDPARVQPGAIEAAVQGMGYSIETQGARRQGP